MSKVVRGSIQQVEHSRKAVWLYNFTITIHGEQVDLTKRFSQIFEYIKWASHIAPKSGIVPLSKPLFSPSNAEQRKQRHQLLTKSLQSALSVEKIADSFVTAFFVGIPYKKSTIVGKRILFPLPDKDFDPSEFSIPWHAFSVCGAVLTVATPSGNIPKAEPLVLNPEGVAFGELGATFDVIQLYKNISSSPEFQNVIYPSPEFQKVISYQDIVPQDYDAVHLNGGHAPGMREYLENKTLQNVISEMVQRDIPIGAICHGTLLLARCQGRDGKSVIYNRKVTTLPYFMEKFAITLTSRKLGSAYYQTYDIPCATEVESLLKSPELFQRGPLSGNMGSLYDDSNAWVVVDGNIITARFPGDAYKYAKEIIKQLKNQ